MAAVVTVVVLFVMFDVFKTQKQRHRTHRIEKKKTNEKRYQDIGTKRNGGPAREEGEGGRGNACESASVAEKEASRKTPLAQLSGFAARSLLGGWRRSAPHRPRRCSSSRMRIEGSVQ